MYTTIAPLKGYRYPSFQGEFCSPSSSKGAAVINHQWTEDLQLLTLSELSAPTSDHSGVAIPPVKVHSLISTLVPKIAGMYMHGHKHTHSHDG